MFLDLLLPPSRNILRRLVIMQGLDKRGWRRLSRLCSRWVALQHGVHVSPSARFLGGLKLPHPTGIVIGKGVRMGANVTIFQGVTLGGRKVGAAEEGGYPMIEDDVVIYANAIVLGDLQVGRGSVVAGGAVVTKSVPCPSIVAGVPARIVGTLSCVCSPAREP